MSSDAATTGAGSHIAAILGTNQSLLEAVLLKRRVVGPAWLALSKPVRIDAGRQVSCHSTSKCWTRNGSSS